MAAEQSVNRVTLSNIWNANSLPSAIPSTLGALSRLKKCKQMQWQYTILEILDDGVMVQNRKGEVEKLTKINIPRFAKCGDLIRWVEHNFYYVVDENGNVIDR